MNWFILTIDILIQYILIRFVIVTSELFVFIHQWTINRLKCSKKWLQWKILKNPDELQIPFLKSMWGPKVANNLGFLRLKSKINIFSIRCYASHLWANIEWCLEWPPCVLSFDKFLWKRTRWEHAQLYRTFFKKVSFFKISSLVKMCQV